MLNEMECIFADDKITLQFVQIRQMCVLKIMGGWQ